MSQKIFGVLFLLAILLAPLYLGAVYLWSFSLTVFILTASFYCYWFSAQKKPDAAVIKTRLDGVLVFYFIFFILSAVYSQIPYRTAVEGFKTLSIFCVFLATLYYCRTRQGIYSLATSMMLLGGALSFFGLLQLLGAASKHWWYNPHFLSSVYVNHNHFAGLIEIILPISIGLVLAEENRSKKILFAFLVFLMGTAFILSLSRGGFLAMTFGLGIMVFLLAIKKTAQKAFWTLISLALIVLSAVALFGFQPLLLQRLETMKHVSLTDDLSMAARVSIWKGTLALISKNFWFGTGPGTFDAAFFKFRPNGFMERPGFAHNDYLQLFADCGVFVFLTVAAFFSVLFYRGLKILQKHQSIFSLGLTSGCLAAIAALAAHSIVDFNFHIPANWIFFTSVAGMLISVGTPKSYSSRVAQITIKCFITIICGSVLAGCIFFGLSDWLLWKGNREQRVGQYTTAISYYDRSIRVNPFNPETYFQRALISGSSGDAEKDLLQAIRFQPLEPYYELELARFYFKSTKPDALKQGILHCLKTAQKDPKDPQIQYLSARELLLANLSKDKEVEREAMRMLKASLELDPLSAFSVYKILWEYEKKIKPLEDFNVSAPEGFKGFVEFLAREYPLKDRRKYYLNKLGIDSDEKYRRGSSIQWKENPAEIFSLNDFDRIGQNTFSKDDFIYANGRLEKKISLKNPLTRVVFKAKGSNAGNSYPVLLVWLDGKIVDLLNIDSSEFIHFFSILQTDPGSHTLGIEFVSDSIEDVSKRDRNVWIETIALYEPAS